MRKITGNKGRLFSRGTAAGLVLLLILAGWTTTAAAQMTQLDWSKVQAIKPGTPITAVLYKDQGPRGDRKVRGRFQSATDDSLILKMEYGPTRTLPRSAVRKVVVRHRPPKSKRDWSRVQAVALGTPAAVVLYKDQAPSWELRRIKGRFHSATDDSLTLTLDDGQTRTLPKSAVRKVLTRRPIGKRYQGWITLGIAAALSASGDVSPIGVFLITGLFTGIGFLAAPKMGGIYNVPPKYRVRLQKDKPSGAESKAPGKQKR